MTWILFEPESDDELIDRLNDESVLFQHQRNVRIRRQRSRRALFTLGLGLGGFLGVAARVPTGVVAESGIEEFEPQAFPMAGVRLDLEEEEVPRVELIQVSATIPTTTTTAPPTTTTTTSTTVPAPLRPFTVSAERVGWDRVPVEASAYSTTPIGWWPDTPRPGTSGRAVFAVSDDLTGFEPWDVVRINGDDWWVTYTDDIDPGSTVAYSHLVTATSPTEVVLYEIPTETDNQIRLVVLTPIRKKA